MQVTLAMQVTLLDTWLMALPGVTAESKWGDDWVYMVSGKMFCVHALAGASKGAISFKVDAHRFLELTDQPSIRPAPYLARAMWVQLPHPENFPADWLQEQLMCSYQIIRDKLPKRLRPVSD